MSKFQIRSKIWLEFQGQPFLGDGRYRLLTEVDRSGSINAAAKTLGISYRKAWAQLDAMESHAPFLLLERRIGGKGGGATSLTPAARELLKNFQELRGQVNAAADSSFETLYRS